MTPREKAIKYLLDIVQEIDPTGTNTKILGDEMALLDDDQFALLIKDYEAGKDRPAMYVPVFGPVDIDVERNFAIGERIGHQFFQQLIIGSPSPDVPSYVTPPKYLILDMPYRRTVQIQEEGMSVAEHNNSIDMRTGAVSGASAASKLSGPEFNVLAAMGMDRTIQEHASVRGGDAGSWAAMEALFARDGEASLDNINHHATGPESVRSLGSLLTSIHIANTL